MLAAFIILIVLICASPIAMFLDGNLAIGVEAVMAGVATGVMARKAADTEFLVQLSRLPFVLIAVPALWMSIQLLPLGYLGIANPVWQSTQQTLGYALVGSIAIDTGAALVGLIHYSAVAAIVLLSMAISLDRLKADGLLFALLIITTLVCLADLISRIGILPQLDMVIGNPAEVGSVRDLGALGVLLAVTAAIWAFERWQSSHSFSTFKLGFSLVGSITALAICSSLLATSWTGNLLVSLAVALTVLLTTTFIRRFGLGVAAAFAALLLTLTVSIIWIQYGSRTFDPMFSFSDDDALVSITRGMLSDAPWFGNGLGSFKTLAPVYQQPGEPIGSTLASTAAAKIAIELGRPMLWMIAVMILLAIAALLRGAFRRGRDSFYPALGASCLIALLIRGFGGDRMFAQVVSVVAAAILGLAFAQRSSRRAIR